jgi:anti-anti-sigma factor
MRHGELKVWTDEWDGVPVIGAEGELDTDTHDVLRAAASQVVCRKPERVIFDLRKVSYAANDSFGVLIATRKRLDDPNSVVVITDQQSVLRALRITGLDRVLRVLREPETA